MAEYILSNAAEEDVRAIYRYSVEGFGEVRASAYLQSLDECLLMLADNPEVGKDVSHVRLDYYQFSHDSHEVFYKKDEEGIYVVRILHGSMDRVRHL